jgi:chemotaxis protein MotA
MFTIIGLVTVLGCVIGGFAYIDGPMHVLFQPGELIIIGGAGIGSLLISAPGKSLGMVMSGFGSAFTGSSPTKSDYLDLLKMQYEVFQFMRKNGAVALDEHVQDLHKSAIFSKYPSFLKNHHAVDFLRDALKQIVNGTASAEELDTLLDTELDTHHEEHMIPVGLIQKVGDAFPALGIVAAVLGIIVTMGHMDAAPAVIGHHVAAALVGTFLGILLCYGMVQPLANSVELQEAHQLRYLAAIKAGLMVSLRGSSPAVAVEFARKMIFTDERPSFADVDKALQALKSR